MLDKIITSENFAATQQLEALVGLLTDGDLQQDLGDGWNAATALAHCAFWDRRAASVFQRWLRDGTPYRDQDDDILNDSLLDEWRALPPRLAANLAVDAARAVSTIVAELPESIAATLTAEGNEFLLRRYNHQREHIHQIEVALR